MAPIARRSITRKSAVRGTGLHTGAATEATFLPAPAGQGIVFRRTDLPGKPEVPARLTEVEAVERRTAIGHGAATIHTVEHLLAAVAAHVIDDLTIELTGPEPPILDGSVKPYFDALAQAEPAPVGGEPCVLTVTAPFTVTDKDAAYVVAPAKTFRLTVSIEWRHPLIGRQAGTYEVTPESFATELAAARTFGFTHEVADLQARGLIKGASAANAIVLDDRGVVNGGDGHQQNHGLPAASLSLPAGGPDRRGGRTEAHRGHQERHHQRAVLPGTFPRPSHHARCADHRGDGPGGRDAADESLRRSGYDEQGRVLHVARQREVPAPGRAR